MQAGWWGRWRKLHLWETWCCSICDACFAFLTVTMLMPSTPLKNLPSILWKFSFCRFLMLLLLTLKITALDLYHNTCTVCLHDPASFLSLVVAQLHLVFLWILCSNFWDRTRSLLSFFHGSKERHKVFYFEWCDFLFFLNAVAPQCFLAGVSELGVSMGYASSAHCCVWPTDSGWIGGLTWMHWFFIDGSCFSHPYDCAIFYISKEKRATSIDNHGCSVALRDLACQQTGICTSLWSFHLQRQFWLQILSSMQNISLSIHEERCVLSSPLDLCLVVI